MKKLSIFALAAAGMLAVGCADKDVVESSQLNQYNMVEGQSAFIAVGIATPGAPVTRANEDLVDGEAKEFAVNNGIIVLFKGTSEDNAKLVKAYNIDATFSKEADDNVPGHNTLGTDENEFGEVTSTSTKIIQEIEAPNLGVDDKLYAYVILNAGTLPASSQEISSNTTGIEFTAGTPFSTFKMQPLKAIGIDNEATGYGQIDETKGLVMTNVPIALTPGGDVESTGAVTTLAEIKQENIYTTREAAAATGASMACIYVERAAVKVQIDDAATPSTLDLDTEASPVAFAIQGWALGNVNYGNATDAPGYYNTRQCEDAWLPYLNNQAPEYTKYRFVGATKFFDANHATAYRTYFAKDVNYTREILATGTATESGLKGAKLEESNYQNTNKVLYTYENTFDENSQIYSNTTYVGFKAQIGDGTTFYTVDGQPNTRYTSAAIETIVQNHANAQKATVAATLNTAIQADLEKTTSTINATRTGDDKIASVEYDLTATDITKGTKNATNGSVGYKYKLALENIVAKNSAGTAVTLTPAEENAIKAFYTTAETEYTSDVTAYEYTDGVAYYSVRIAHFGAGDANYANAETPWSAPAEAYNDYEKIYPRNGQSLDAPSVNYGASRAAAWLGRWGIVRNNWYVLKINAVYGIGSPVPEDFSSNVKGTPGSTPDDNPKPKYYIAAHVHILPWVKRFQEVNF